MAAGKIVLCLLAATAAAAVWFGLNAGLGILLNKYAWGSYAVAPLASLPAIAVLACLSRLYPVHAGAWLRPELYLIVLAAAAVSAWIVSPIEGRPVYSGGKLLLWGLRGALMEIPQRLMMQTLAYAMLRWLQAPRPELFAILCTALVWCFGIAMQNILLRQPFDMKWLRETGASLVFSLGIGYVYQASGILLLGMAGHFLERIVSSRLTARRVKNSV